MIAMPDFSGDHFNLLLRCHGFADMYGYSYGQHNANFADFQRHTLLFRQHFSIGMALHSPQPHSWCWFCHSFGRFNCLLFQILHPRNAAAIHPLPPQPQPPPQPPVPSQAPPRRELTQPPVPMYVRQGARTLDATPVPPPPQPPPAQGYPKYWDYQPAAVAHAKPEADAGNAAAAAKKPETIGYYQLEIRQNVVNIPPNLNRFIPYHIPDAGTATRGGADDGNKSFATDNYCDFPPIRRHGNNHGMNTASNGQGTSLYF